MYLPFLIPLELDAFAKGISSSSELILAARKYFESSTIFHTNALIFNEFYLSKVSTHALVQ